MAEIMSYCLLSNSANLLCTEEEEEVEEVAEEEEEVEEVEEVVEEEEEVEGSTAYANICIFACKL